MQNRDFQYFELLKKEIVRALKLTYPGISDKIEEWKGQTISYLQEDLIEKVNEHISEKWFYNHMKMRSRKLPRIDMLNLLCRYSGYTGWDDFVFKNQSKISSFMVADKSNRVFILVPLLVLFILAITFFIYKILITKEYRFCFVDSYDFTPIASDKTQIDLLNDDESPRIYLSDTTGCAVIRTDKRKIRFVVRSPYYKTDTIERILKKFNRTETVALKTNDYALMIHYFSTANVNDWKKRREQLDKMFADTAVIFEVFNQGALGMEIYDKWEFINKITIPASNLRQIEILDTEYFQDQIVILRFTRKKREDEI
jgi:hypothetical protein